MATSAPQVQYRQEFLLDFEQRKSKLLQSVTNEAVIKGNTATFIITSSDGRSAVTRGLNSLIPSRSQDMTQVSATLTEWHDKPIMTGFNIFQSQGDQRKAMQMGTAAVINRKIDELIIAQLDTATNSLGSAVVGSPALILKAKAKLVNNSATSGTITAVISPAFEYYLSQTPEFTSVDYVKTPEFGEPDMQMFKWRGINFIVHENLTGNATASEKCYMFNKEAVGCAMDTKGLQMEVGYNTEDDYSFSRMSAYMGAKLLNQSGVIQILHNGSALA